MIRQAIRAAVGRFLPKFTHDQQPAPPRRRPKPAPQAERKIVPAAGSLLTLEQRAEMVASERKLMDERHTSRAERPKNVRKPRVALPDEPASAAPPPVVEPAKPVA
jgi:hypothetical protein